MHAEQEAVGLSETRLGLEPVLPLRTLYMGYLKALNSLRLFTEFPNVEYRTGNIEIPLCTVPSFWQCPGERVTTANAGRCRFMNACNMTRSAPRPAARNAK